ncbi:hypothetical protein FB45DRAFT_894269 [Roridomyces roridus]|uniref:Uncharacterized protein n=1 Tax=Roridomyces roridus TaxID=1738132 RepID=A0AAD7CG31_9AGAR|nr:hypothetical protein FB45DRAFT_894269 [Roridomyces roridus]
MLQRSLRCTRFPRRDPRILTAVHSIPRPESTFVSMTPDKLLYTGPLTATFKRLKIFSLSSLGLCATLTPFMFAIETTSLPWSARAILAGTALSTSGVSTGLIAWAGTADNTIRDLELTTLTLSLQPRITRVFDPLFFVSTNRAFAKWELAQLVLLPADLRNTIPGQEETVAETTDAKGRVLGRWVVKWGEGGEGTCHEVGKVVKYFNLHDELLPSLSEVPGPGAAKA